MVHMFSYLASKVQQLTTLQANLPAHERKSVSHCLSYDVASGSKITPCNKIDKPLVVYRLTGNVMTSITTFYGRNDISKLS